MGLARSAHGCRTVRHVQSASGMRTGCFRSTRLLEPASLPTPGSFWAKALPSSSLKPTVLTSRFARRCGRSVSRALCGRLRRATYLAFSLRLRPPRATLASRFGSCNVGALCSLLSTMGSTPSTSLASTVSAFEPPGRQSHRDPVGPPLAGTCQPDAPLQCFPR